MPLIDRGVRLTTARLSLRPTNVADAARAFEIQSNWRVTRMLRMARFPPDRDETQKWFADHEKEWLGGLAYRFAADLDGRMIGVVDIDEIDGRCGSLGYWFDEDAWGVGYASEAATAVVRFGFNVVQLAELRSSHAEDNVVSGQVLQKLGFEPIDSIRLTSRSRNTLVLQCRYSMRSGVISRERT